MSESIRNEWKGIKTRLRSVEGWLTLKLSRGEVINEIYRLGSCKNIEGYPIDDIEMRD